MAKKGDLVAVLETSTKPIKIDTSGMTIAAIAETLNREMHAPSGWSTQSEIEIHLLHDDTDIRLPVLPSSYEVSDPMNNETVNIHTKGEITLLGTRGQKTLELSSFFPAEGNDYGFIQGEYPDIGGNYTKPYNYIHTLAKWEHARDTVELYITGTNIKWDASIESLKYLEDDASGDVSYTISLKEYKNIKKRLTKKVKTVKIKTKKGDTCRKLAYKYLGKSSYASVIYKQNKAVIEKYMKKYIRKYNKHHKKNLSYKSSQHGKHLAPGTPLIIKKEIATK